MELRLVSDDGDVLRLAAFGRIVHGEVSPDSEPIGRLLGDAGYGRTVLLSLAQTHFIDSTGLSWLVVCHKRFCEDGGRLVVHSAGPAVRQLLKLMRLDLALNLFEDEAGALEVVRPRG